MTARNSTLEPGWLKRAAESARAEMRTWPDWKLIAVDQESAAFSIDGRRDGFAMRELGRRNAERFRALAQMAYGDNWRAEIAKYPYWGRAHLLELIGELYKTADGLRARIADFEANPPTAALGTYTARLDEQADRIHDLESEVARLTQRHAEVSRALEQALLELGR